MPDLISHHRKIRVYRCRICGTTFKVRGNLEGLDKKLRNNGLIVCDCGNSELEIIKEIHVPILDECQGLEKKDSMKPKKSIKALKRSCTTFSKPLNVEG